MKKIYKLFCLFVILFIFPLFVNAENCSKEEKNRINKLINNINIAYIHTDNNYFTVNIYNIPEGLYVSTPTNGMLYPTNNTVTLNYYIGGNSYTFNFFSINGDKCIDEMKYSKTIYIKQYNVYSEKEVCKNKKYKDFKYCNKWYQGYITDEKYELELKKYESKLKQNEQVVNVEDNTNDTNKIKINMNIILIGSGCVILGITITIILVVRKKKRRKL